MINKSYRISIVAFALSAACIIAYNLIGPEVAPDGRLIEPFAFIPLGYVFGLIGIITVIIGFVRSRKK